jgi:hypothetical protein
LGEEVWYAKRVDRQNSPGDRSGGVEDPYLISNIDPVHLKNREQVLLALTDSGTGHALTVYVMDTATRSFKKVWEADGVPNVGACAPAHFVSTRRLGEATASATDDRQIVVKMPVPSRRLKSELLVAVFAWTEQTYRLAREQMVSRYKWNGRDWDGIGNSGTQNCE